MTETTQDGGTRLYRIYPLRIDGTVYQPVEIYSDNDHNAIAAARLIMTARECTVELWQGDRCLGRPERLPNPTPREPDPIHPGAAR